MPSYTAKELEQETGVDRRTIAYYVQEGLLPKVGRRGRRTRYPRLFRDRLLFVQRVREAEAAGEVSAVSLSDIRKVFERVPPALIAGVADGRIAVTPELVSEPSTAFRTPGMRRATVREGMPAPASLPAPRFSPGTMEERTLAESLRRLEELARRRNEESPRSRNTWTRINISRHLVLSARGIGEEDAVLVERVRRAIRRVIKRGR